MKQSRLTLLQCVIMLCLLYAISIAVFYLADTTEYAPNDSTLIVRLVILVFLAPIFVKYIIQIFFSPFYSLVEKHAVKKASRLGVLPTDPLVSVLIPAWNEEVGIIKTIQSVLKSSHKKLEVIIINDGSTDSTDLLVTEFIKKYEKNKPSNIAIKYLSLVNGGKAKALNEALKVVTGEFVVTVDADCFMDPQAISQMIKRFTDDKVAAVAGNVIVGNRKKPIELIQQLEYLYGFYFRKADSIFNSVYIIGGAAAAYRNSVLQEIGGFDHNIITEDVEMSTRILAHGYKTRYAADAVVFTEGPSDFKSLCSQRLRWKFGRILTFIKHKKLFFSVQKKHNPYLTFFLLPLAIYAEIALLFEGLSLTAFYAYTIYSSHYMPLVFVISFMTLVICLQILFDSKARFHSNLIILAPVAWLLFYFIDLVEFQALYRSLKRLVKRQDLQWQKWVRVGLLSSSIPSSDIVVECEK